MTLHQPLLRDPRSFQFDLPPEQRPPRAALAEKWKPDLYAPSLQASSERVFDPVLGVRTVVIHGTAGASSDGACSVIRSGRASFHWLVPDEDEAAHGRHVWATTPERRAAWHVRNNCSHPDVWGGRKRINHSSLGIEIVNAMRGGDAFSPWQVKAAADIVRYAWAKYPNLAHVVGHARLDPERRTDPGAHFPWEEFRAAVLFGT